MEKYNEIANKSIEIRSEEVQEIISHIPNWIIRWGITLIFLVFISILLISWFVKYPDIIKAKVVLTTSPAVMTLVSRSSGNLILLKKENEEVKEGEHIGYIMSNTALDNVLLLEDYLSKLTSAQTIISPPSQLRLGELQDAYNDFLNASENLNNHFNLDPANIQIKQLKQQLNIHIRLKEILLDQAAMSEEETNLAHSGYEMDSTLFAQKLISPSEYIGSKTSYLQNVRNNRNMEITVANEEIQIQTVKNQITDLTLQQKEKQSNFTLAYTNALRILRMRSDQWKEANVFIAPAAGTIAFLGFLENKMFVEQGKSLFSVVPKSGYIYAQAEIPVAGSGKIKEGQRVNIRLNNYPSEQFGMLYGEISEISILPNGDKYLAKIGLTNGLNTSHQKQLPFKQHLQGETEIITEDLRLLDRIFYQFRKLLS